MASRQSIWNAVKWNANVPLYMDGRIGGEALQLLTLNPSDYDAINVYEKWLFTDEEAAQLPCAARTVIHPPTVLAGLMVASLTQFARGRQPKANIMANLQYSRFAL